MTAKPFYDIPFVPTQTDRLETMIELAQQASHKVSLDLGSGDGRVVIAMARLGIEAHGIEIDQDRYELTRKVILDAGFDGQAFAHLGSFWDLDLSRYDLITIYGITGMMDRLEKKLIQEAQSGTRFISNGFFLPHKLPAKSENHIHLYVF